MEDTEKYTLNNGESGESSMIVDETNSGRLTSSQYDEQTGCDLVNQAIQSICVD